MSHVLEFSGVRQAAREDVCRKSEKRRQARNRQLLFEPLEDRRMLSAWPMKQADIWNTGRADYVVPSERLNDTFFDVFLWQQRTPGSPLDGDLSSTSMTFYDGVGPGGADLVVGGYHWPKGVQGMDRHTGEVFWFGNPDGGESIGRNTPAFSNDGSVIYVTNDATPHPLMAFESTEGPSGYWHNGDDSGVTNLMGSPVLAPDGRVFLHGWYDRAYGATDNGTSLTTTWSAATQTRPTHSEPTLYEDAQGLRVIVPGNFVAAYDGGTGTELWNVATPSATEATATIDPANGNVYVSLGSGDIYVAGLDKEGRPLWGSASVLVYDWIDGSNNPQRAQSAGALSHDGATYYFQTVNQESDGQLYAINTVDGSVKWSYATGSGGWHEPVSSPIVTSNGVIVVGNNAGDTYFAIRDVGTEGQLLDTYVVDEAGTAKASATLSADGRLYLPLRTVQIVGTPSEAPSVQVENLFTAFDMTADAQATLPPPGGQKAIALNHQVVVGWREVPDPAGSFDHYAIYRGTAPFGSVEGMFPIATVSDITTTEYSDTTAENGTSYYYAVTTVTTTGGQQTNVSSIGPRTPRDETDLQVISIARSPEFPRYDPQYTYYEVTEPSGFGPYIFSASTGLGGGQTFEDQRFPDIGDPVTYTATVRNRGTNNWGGTISVSWFLDGDQVLANGPVVNLAPGETTTFTYNLAWDNQSHELLFTINVVDARPENNTLTSDPLAVPFLTYMDESFVEDFREVYTTDPSQNDDIIDWLNSHMARFNEMFLEAGSAKRVHYGVLEVLADDAPDPPLDYSDNPYAIFPFRYRKTDGNPRLSGYYYGPEDIDYGLIHEMAHQLGMIDIYQMDVPAEANLVSGLAYLAPNGVMRGVSHFISEFHALAMDHWLHEAHGYYGQFLYNLPQTLKLRLLDYEGQPLSGAQVTMYQYAERPGQGKVISNQVKATGLTDEQGYFTLPNVDINEALVPPVATGDVLHDNPFGYVAVVGTNGVLHFRVEKDGATDYCWLDITEANVEYWNGHVTEAVFDRQLMLGMPVQTQPPVDLAEPSAGGWIAWADGATATAEYDTERTVAGTASLKFVTDGGFDTAARYPGDYIADWDLSDAEYLALSVYAENDNTPTFQGGSPWIRLIDADGDFFQYQYTVNGWPVDVLIDAIGSWQSWQIPLDAPEPVPGEVGSGWRRTAHGTPDLTSIQALEFHADTWGAGFRYWLDGVGFDRLIAYPDAYLAAQNGQQNVGPDSGVLANDVAPSETSLTAEVVAEPMHGQLVLNPDGSFRYTPDAGFVGQDRFTYVARAGEAVSNAGEVLLDVLQTTFTVTNTDDEGPGSLRDALLLANSSPLGPVTIDFRIPDTDPRFIDIDNDLPGGDPQPDVFVIRSLSPLPALENRSTAIVLDGRTQVSLTGNTNPAGPVIVLDGNTEGVLATGLEIRSDGNAIFGLNIVGFAYQGIYIAGSDNQIVGNYIGTDATGNRTTYPFGGETLRTRNGSNGIEVWYARRNEIRDNVISGNDREGVRIFGPEIPVFQWPVSEGGNGHYYVISPPSTWAGAEALARQLDISGDPNQRSSYLATITSVQEQEFLNRRFFTDMLGNESFFMGLTDEAEEGTFVWVTGEPVSYTNWADGEPNDLGGEDYGMVNTFYGLGKWNDIGGQSIARGIIELEFTPDMEELLPLLGTGGNRVSGNKIGTDASGQEALPNGLSGIFLERTQQTLIGGVLGDDWSLADGNLISGNGWEGITVGWGCTDTQILGNYIGTDIDGADAVSNRERGIAIYRSARSSIGSAAGIEGNLISGNGRHGVLVEDWDIPVYEWSLDDGGNGHHYAVLPSMNWDAAEQVAQAMGGHLASITSADEQSFVRANILGDDAFLYDTLWIGLNDILQEGRFVWTSGEPVSYTNWHPNEINGDGGDGENAVVINARRDTPAERGTWSDARRSGHLRALVEFSTPPDPAELAEVSGEGGHRIAGNRIGTTRDGLAALQNAEAGIHLANSSRNVLGGSDAERGNLISGNAQTGIWIYGKSSRGNIVEGNFIGLTAAGDAALGNGRHGVLLDWAPENRLGPDNVISANTEHGVAVWGMSSEGNEITGNRIGTAVDGQVALGNGWHGIETHAAATLIRGNLVSGNHQHGISLHSSEIPVFTRPEDGRVYVVAPSNTWAEAERWAQQLGGDLATINDQAEQDFLRETILEGRFPNEWFWIGLNDRVREGDFMWSGEDSAFRNWHPGSPDTGNSGVEKNGVVINYRTSDEDPRGLWSDVRSGMWLRALIECDTMPDIQRVHHVLNAGGAVVQGNWIGLQAQGSSDLGNLDGIWIGAPNNVIGGANPREGNVVAWNRGGGIELHGDSSAYNTVLGNYVGTDPSGALAWGNQGNGTTIAHGAHHNTIGGTEDGAANVFADNGQNGVSIFATATSDNLVQGNLIGVQADGRNPLPNIAWGLQLSMGASFNTADGNVIGGNGQSGVRIVDLGTDDNEIVGNWIGTDRTRLLDLGNARHGIEIANAARNQIGGILPGQGNVIAYNREHGVEVGMDAAIGNTIRGNSIDDNGWLGINLGGNGVTPNDPGDVDTGPNNLQNYPVLSAAVAGSITQITGQLDSTPDSTFAIDFYTSPAADPSGNGEGARYLGSTLVTTDAAGTAVFDVVLPVPGSGGDVVTATATDADGNTSEFSAALTMVSQQAATAIQLVAVHAPSPTDEHGEVADQPLSADWVHEWQSFWVEIWVSTPDTTTVGVAQATVDLRYNTSYLTAQQIVHGPAFTLAQTGVIDDAQGLVSAIGGRTSLHNVGDDGYVLLARVKFTSTGEDQVPVDEGGRNIGPYGMQMVLHDGQVVLVGGAEVDPELGVSPRTELWAVVYDIDDNNEIDFGDLSFFAPAFGLTVGSTVEPPFVWWADFDKSGRVDFGDLSFFAPNFNNNRTAVQAGTQTLIFPPRFPDPWRAGTGGGEGEGEGEGESEREAAWDSSAGGVGVTAGTGGSQRAPVPPWQLAWAVDEAHAALHAEQSTGLPWGTTARPQPQPALPLWQESAGTLYSRSDEPELASDERRDRLFEVWEPLEDLLTTLAVS